MYVGVAVVQVGVVLVGVESTVCVEVGVYMLCFVGDAYSLDAYSLNPVPAVYV